MDEILFHREIEINPNGNGTLYILHGLFGSSDNWQSTAKSFSKYSKVVLIDLRNHGRSPHFPHHNYDLMANDILNLMGFLGHEDVAVLGHSMGGKAAMTLALNNPDKVSELIVADISPRYYPPHHQLILKALSSVDFSVHRQRSDVQNIMSEYIKDPAVVQFLMKGIGRDENQALTWKFNLEVISRDIENIGEAQNTNQVYDGPVKFISGGNSNYVLEEDKLIIERLFPKVQYSVIPNAGHWLHAEQPKLFVAAINQ
jgi:pimeloyl-ACP methyl ester carboxylesterase